MVVYPYKRFSPENIAKSVPDGYVIGHSPTGFMTADTFFTCIKTGLYPQLVADNVQFPVLVLFDGHKSHISMDLHDFYKAHSIHLYLLYPNSTHILQPCDVAIFRPLKQAWRQVVAKHAQESTEAITKVNFAPLFNQAFEQASDPLVIKKAFECCGLYPFDPNAPDYTKCISTRRLAMKKDDCIKNLNGNVNEIISSTVTINDGNSSGSNNSDTPTLDSNVLTVPSLNQLHLIETNIPKDILSMFNDSYESKKIPPKEVILFELWKKVKESLVDDNAVSIEINQYNSTSGSADHELSNNDEPLENFGKSGRSILLIII